MELFHAVLLMLLMIGFSHVISRFIPAIPSPLILIALGAIVALLPSGVHLEMEPELFFILFIAPLLYNDGKHTPRRELWRLRAPILLLAVGLVFITVLVAGYAIHWLIPTIPLPAAFGLAAILSPTDAVAVGALAKRIHMPETLLRLLEGESLMNDASGLVAFNFAIAATVTGVFSMTHAIFSFLVIAIGGLLIGVIVALLIVWLGVTLRRSGLEDVTLHMLIQILTPFLLYLIAEEIGVSGILAAVAGGLVHAIERDRVDSAMLRLNIVSNNTWSVLLYVLNGLVFLLLGLQIPHVTSVVLRNASIDNTQVFIYAFLIFLLLVVLRFVWTFIFTRNQRLFGVEQKQGQEMPDYKMLLLTSLGGVRGAVTLAGAFSIPYVLRSGEAFPERDMMIFIAAIVILISLVVSSALLPLLAKRKEAPAEQNRLEQHARIRVLQAAIETLKTEQKPENEAAAISVMTDYQKWVQEEAYLSHTSDSGQPRCRDTETELRIKAIAAERRCIEAMVEEGSADVEQAAKVTELLDQMELVLTKRTRIGQVLIKMFMKKLFAKDRKKSMNHYEEREAMKGLKISMCKSAIVELGEQKRPETETETNYVISQYKQMLGRLSLLQGSRASEDLQQNDMKKEMYWVAIQAERDMVQTLYESGEISRELASGLRGTIRDRETAISEIM